MSTITHITLMEHVPKIIQYDLQNYIRNKTTQEEEDLQIQEHNTNNKPIPLSKKEFIRLMKKEQIDWEPQSMEDVVEELDQITQIEPNITQLIFGNVNQNDEIPYYKVYLTATEQTIPGLHGYIRKPWKSYEELYDLYCNILSQ